MVAICLKRISINLVIEVFWVPIDRIKVFLEIHKVCCRSKKFMLKFVKFKYSVICSYLLSILVYYYFFRVLNVVLEVFSVVV